MLNVGQHCVLIRDGFGPRLRRRANVLPKLGVVYTVRDILPALEPNYPLQVHLVEIRNSPRLTVFGPWEPSFDISRFRPLRPLFTEDFIEGLTPLDQHELLMEYEGIRP